MQETIVHISTMSPLDKMKNWISYMVGAIALKHDYTIDLTDNEARGRGKYDKAIGRFEIRHLWKEEPILALNEFSNINNNVRVHDAGAYWEENNFSAKNWTTFIPGLLFHRVYHAQIYRA